MYSRCKVDKFLREIEVYEASKSSALDLTPKVLVSAPSPVASTAQGKLRTTNSSTHTRSSGNISTKVVTADGASRLQLSIESMKAVNELLSSSVAQAVKQRALSRGDSKEPGLGNEYTAPSHSTRVVSKPVLCDDVKKDSTRRNRQSHSPKLSSMKSSSSRERTTKLTRPEDTPLLKAQTLLNELVKVRERSAKRKAAESSDSDTTIPGLSLVNDSEPVWPGVKEPGHTSSVDSKETISPLAKSVSNSSVKEEIFNWPPSSSSNVYTPSGGDGDHYSSFSNKSDNLNWCPSRSVDNGKDNKCNENLSDQRSVRWPPTASSRLDDSTLEDHNISKASDGSFSSNNAGAVRAPSPPNDEHEIGMCIVWFSVGNIPVE